MSQEFKYIHEFYVTRAVFCWKLGKPKRTLWFLIDEAFELTKKPREKYEKSQIWKTENFADFDFENLTDPPWLELG